MITQDDIYKARCKLIRMQTEYLEEKGWIHTFDTPGSLELLERIWKGKRIITDGATAIEMQTEYFDKAFYHPWGEVETGDPIDTLPGVHRYTFDEVSVLVVDDHPLHETVTFTLTGPSSHQLHVTLPWQAARELMEGLENRTAELALDNP